MNTATRSGSGFYPAWVAGLLCLIGAQCLLAQGDVTAERRLQVFDVVEPTAASVVGNTWHYFYEVVQPSLTSAELVLLADGVRRVRDSADADLVASLVAEESALRDAAKVGDRQGYRQTQERWCFVGQTGDLFERALIDGGYGRGMDGSGTTTQTFITGADVFYRTDCGLKGTTGALQVSKRENHHTWRKAIFVDEWMEHAALIKYCKESGTSERAGVFVVARAQLRFRPPTDIVCPYHGEQLVMQVKKAGQGVAIYTSLFDGAGRLCYEWTSQWIEGQPVVLRSRWFWTGSSQLRHTRGFTIPRVSDHGPLPGLAEMVAMPFEKRKMRDLRGEDIAAEVDPLGGSFDSVLRPRASDAGGVLTRDRSSGGSGGAIGYSRVAIAGLDPAAGPSNDVACLPWQFEFEAEQGTRDLRFSVYNGGLDAITITKIEASCGCVQIRPYNEKLEGFGCANVDFTLDIPKLDKVEIVVHWKSGETPGRSVVRITKKPVRAPR